MSNWRRSARLVIAVFVVAFLVVVVFAFKRRAPAAGERSLPRTDPNAVVESTGGRMVRLKGVREDIAVEYQRQLTYASGSTKLIGVKVTTENRAGGKSFTITGKEGEVGQNQSTIALNGDVRLVASDGMEARTEHATYAENDGIIHAPGPVTLARGRLSGSGMGFTFDRNQDVITILDQAVVHVGADEHGAGAADVASGSAVFARREKTVRFERSMRVQRSGQTIDADTGTAYLSPDEKRIETIELRGNSRITTASPAEGALQSLTGRDMNLKYAADGQALERALIVGSASIQLAGQPGKSGRQIAADTIDVTLGPDGSTPTALVGRDNVQLVFPSEGTAPTRTVRAATLDGTGAPGRGLTQAVFTGNVDFREKGPSVDRVARSGALTLALKPGMGAIDDARFSKNVRFEEGAMTAAAAAARYLLEKGVIELTGVEPGTPAPHVVNEQIAVDAARIDLTLQGSKMKASGTVKSVLQPKKRGAKGGDSKMPSMLKQDQPVNVTGNDLNYDGSASKAVYTGNAQLWQGDTAIAGDTVAIDDKSGDLAASGSVRTSVILEQLGKDKKTKERTRSVGTAKDFTYQESTRRATYTGDAHLSGQSGDLTATRIELFLKASGDELDRAEAYDAVTLREPDPARKTTGNRLTYFGADERYLVTGTPVTVVDECGRETIGKTLTFFRAADRIIVDGNERIRTQTKGGANCK